MIILGAQGPQGAPWAPGAPSPLRWVGSKNEPPHRKLHFLEKCRPVGPLGPRKWRPVGPWIRMGHPWTSCASSWALLGWILEPFVSFGILGP